MPAESLKVAVRVRPFNQRENDRNAKCIIRMSGINTTIINPDTQEEKEFAFDYSYWSHDGFDVLEAPEDDLGYPGEGYNAPTNRRGGPTTSEFGSEYASQKEVYEGLGRGVLNNALEGYNCCLFAYGQTGSGKSYSFVGYGSNKGVVPQVCDEVFKRKVDIEASGTTQLQVTFSMMEIYNEKIRDLLNPDAKTNNDLKVRTTPKGTYVEGVKAKAVGSYEAIQKTMDAGTASRTVAATQMNATSSRAHTIMTIAVKQIITEGGRTKEIASDMNLVDLAGSERAESTGATGDRLKEGAAINKSLSALGNVISALADQANNPKGKKKVFVPYRDSKLTQILQSALGGNSKTIMVAALSPADINFEETLSTLRYADRAKQIKVVVEVQENPTDKLIRQLKEENDKLRKMMEAMGGDGFDPAAMGGGDDASRGTITEDQMAAAIEEAVAQVKKTSAAEKAAAIEAVKAEMRARSDGLSQGMLARADMDQTIRDAIEAAGKSPKDKEKALVAYLKEINPQTKKRQAGGEDDTFSKGDVAAWAEKVLRAMGCTDEEVQRYVAAAELRFDQLLQDGSDGIVDEGVMRATVERALAALGGNPKDKQVAEMVQEALKLAGYTGRQSLAAADAQQRAKMQLAAALQKNQEMMNDLTMSFDAKLSQADAESVALLKSLGLSGLSPEEMKVTPSLRNLNQDPTMADALVYYLKAGETLITTPEDADGADAQAIVLSGGGLMAKHGTVRYAREHATPIRFVVGNGVTFVNGKPVDGGEIALRHDDRLILGNTQAFRVVDPLDPEASKPHKQLIDWDLAQTELAEAMGTAVDLKVEEEVAKKKAELDAQFKAMEDKFARENEALRAQLERGGGGASASQAVTLKQLDSRKAAIESHKARTRIHLAELKRELIRLEDSLRKVTPLLKEANVLASHLGRGVKFEAMLVTFIPQSMALSPVEELLTQKVTELLVNVVLSNPRTNESREWLWAPEPFFDRVGHMRTAWQEWMLKSIEVPMHVPSDPFWSPPQSQLIGTAYLYLAPIAYGVPMSEWVPIVDYRSEKHGELCIQLKPRARPTNDPDTLLGKDVRFDLTIEAARGLLGCPSKNVRVEFSWANEEVKRKSTAADGGKKFEPRFGDTHELAIERVGEVQIAYLCKDAICFEVYGEPEDVAEEGVREAIEMEVPPEVFDAFLSYDVQLADGSQQVAFESDGKGAAVFTVAQGTGHRFAFAVAQENRNFRVVNMGNVHLGHVREHGSSASIDNTWAALPITKQSRSDADMTPWVAECMLNFLPPSLQGPECVGKVYDLDLKADVEEIERIGQLEEPIELRKTITLRVVAQGDGTSAAVSNDELKTRLRLTTSKQEVYLGTFEVTDNAVNEAMTALRKSTMEADTNHASNILQKYYSEVESRKVGLIEEQERQFEALALRAIPLGLDLGQSLELWQLPKELLGTAAAVPDDPAALKKLVAELRADLSSSNDQLMRAQKKIVQLEAQLEEAQRKGMKRGASMKAQSSKKYIVASEPPPPPPRLESAGSAKGEAKSSACVIS